ncbi:molybdopterin molybdotransferase [Luteibacter sp. Sphag1AF]|uniref:molybdopterin molybdotransferase MoeA n=1 Tax=Luteibacter sp. Sphag1AF TaxID=2587031 RepID=UPI0016104008|nr:molybdopterin molybdotransferase MoeA [Luteibacter sp. Sphag1AF]MBB3226035.1 molybdopterin molybdotransferase [Luteibacter sp. Sphag1AF]
MIDYATALSLLLDIAPTLEAEWVDVDAASGRVLATDVRSTLALPGFDNAAMDGVALRLSNGPVPAGTRYRVHGMQAAGDVRTQRDDTDACEIATGARLPDGFNTVVPVERLEFIADVSEHAGRTMVLLDDAHPGQHVRRLGDDITEGHIVLRAGRHVDPSAIMLLAAQGIARIDVRRRPRVAIICTGSELREPGSALSPGAIHNSNGPFLRASLRAWGAEVVHYDSVNDDGHAFAQSLDRAQQAGAQVIVTTGAVSAGRFDFIPAALGAAGARTLFHKVAMRPGKPLLAATLPSGPVVVALPGNPMAVAVGLRFFVVPLVRRMLCMSDEVPLQVALVDVPDLREGLQHFVLANLAGDAAGHVHAQPVGRQTAYRVLPYTQASVWLAMTSGEGAIASVFPLEAAAVS